MSNNLENNQTKLFRLLTDDFIGVKMCFMAYFSCKIDTK